MKFNFEFMEDELKVILAGLSELPHKFSAGLHSKIISAAQGQAMQSQVAEPLENVIAPKQDNG